MKIQFTLILIFCVFIAKTQNLTDIVYQDIGYIFIPNEADELPLLRIEKLKNSDSLVIEVKHSKGEAEFTSYRNDGTIKTSGFFSNSLVLFKEYVFEENLFTGASTLHVVCFQRPLPTGTWLYYDTVGCLKDTFNFSGQWTIDSTMICN